MLASFPLSHLFVLFLPKSVRKGGLSLHFLKRTALQEAFNKLRKTGPSQLFGLRRWRGQGRPPLHAWGCDSMVVRVWRLSVLSLGATCMLRHLRPFRTPVLREACQGCHSELMEQLKGNCRRELGQSTWALAPGRVALSVQLTCQQAASLESYFCTINHARVKRHYADHLFGARNVNKCTAPECISSAQVSNNLHVSTSSPMLTNISCSTTKPINQ